MLNFTEMKQLEEESNKIEQMIKDEGIDLIKERLDPQAHGCLEYDGKTKRFTMIINYNHKWEFRVYIMNLLYSLYNQYKKDIIETSFRADCNDVVKFIAGGDPTKYDRLIIN